jgi:hypothetical protein
MGDVTIKGNVKDTLKLQNEFPNNQVSMATIENTAATGYAALEIKTPANSATIKMGKTEGLKIETKEAGLPIILSPNMQQSFTIQSNGDVQSKGGIVSFKDIRSQNFWAEQRITTGTSYTHVDYNAWKSDQKTRKVLGWNRGGAISNYGINVPSMNPQSHQYWQITRTGVYDIHVGIIFHPLNKDVSGPCNLIGRVWLRKQSDGYASKTILLGTNQHHSSSDTSIEYLILNGKVPLEDGSYVGVDLLVHGNWAEFNMPIHDDSWFRLSLCN